MYHLRRRLARRWSTSSSTRPTPPPKTNGGLVDDEEPASPRLLAVPHSSLSQHVTEAHDEASSGHGAEGDSAKRIAAGPFKAKHGNDGATTYDVHDLNQKNALPITNIGAPTFDQFIAYHEKQTIGAPKIIITSPPLDSSAVLQNRTVLPYPDESSHPSGDYDAFDHVHTHEDLFPRKIRCFLEAHVDEETVHQREIGLEWYDKDVYLPFLSEFDQTLGKPHDFANQTLYLRYGVLSLIGEKHISEATFEEREQLTDEVILSVCGFIHNHPYEVFYLRLKMDFSSISKSLDTSQDAFSALAMAMDRKMRKNFQSQEYISRLDLWHLMTRDTLKRLIQQERIVLVSSTMERINNFVDTVYSSAPRLCMVCVVANIKLQFLRHLLDYGCDDSHLPSSKHECTNEECLYLLRRFLKVQPSFFAHSFAEKSSYVSLKDDVIVPIRFDKSKDCLGFGAFGSVYRAHIDPGHHYFSEHRSSPFALKILVSHPTTARAFATEQAVLQELSKLPHDHIMSSLASWSQKDMFYILYPFANSNLREFMRHSPTMRLTAPNTLWFFCQLRGLADALRNLHFHGKPYLTERPIGIGGELEDVQERRMIFHHDIKPENILCFKTKQSNQPSLKLSDFGSAKLQRTRVGTSSRPEKVLRGTLTYEGPDYGLKNEISRPFDVWALGCVFLEFLSWVFIPYKEAVERFADERMQADETGYGENDPFWSRIGNSFILRPAVEARLMVLETEYCRNLPAFEDSLRLIGKMLQIDPKKRMKAAGAFNGFDAIFRQAETDLKASPDMYLREASQQHSPLSQMAFPINESSQATRRGRSDSDSVGTQFGHDLKQPDIEDALDLPP